MNRVVKKKRECEGKREREIETVREIVLYPANANELFTCKRKSDYDVRDVLPFH